MEQFITNLKRLQGKVESITKRKAQLRDELGKVRSEDELETLEKKISKEDDELSVFYAANLSYPENEITAAALTKFLEINPHIQQIMKAFKLHEPLMDDILRARMGLRFEDRGLSA